MTELTLPAVCLVVLVAPPPGFAEATFLPDEIATDEASALAALRRGGRAVWSTPLADEARTTARIRARKAHAAAVAVVFDADGERAARRDGFHPIVRGGAGVRVVRLPNPADLRHRRGPFDLVGDIHGCLSELRSLLGRLGWEPRGDGFVHPERRTLVSVGDLVDRGPDSPGVVRTIQRMVHDGAALCVLGNHDARLARALRGKGRSRSHGLAETLDQLADEPPAAREHIAHFLEGLPAHVVLDGGALVVAHAGCKESLQLRDTPRVTAFCLYGDTTGESDELGLPVRLDWAASYRGAAKVVHGHVPVAEATWVNGVLDLDTGCVFGGKLTALRWPELELVSVAAERTWWDPPRPLA